jgi:hypothetical protein
MKCEICERESDDESLFEKHHLFPVKTRRKSEATIDVCRNCGDQVHLLFDNHELQSRLNTLSALREAMADYVTWVKRRPIGTKFSMQKKKRRR